LKTYQFEALVVGVVLFSVAVLTGGAFVEFVGSLAVLLSFCHAQIADRLAERQEPTKPTVECYRKMNKFWIGKEAFWLVYFLLQASYAALVGVALFLAYPFWRKWWRKRYPLNRNVV
jgi:hypothetical protein